MAKKSNKLSDSEKRPVNKAALGKLSRIFNYMKPYMGKFVLGLVFLLLSSLTLLAFPELAGRLVDAASGNSDWYINDVNQIALLLLGVLLVQSFFSFFRVYLFARVSERSMADIRLDLYSRLLSLPLGFYDKRRTGELFSRITSDVSQLQDTFSITLAEFLRQILTLLVGVFIIFYTTPQLTLFMLATFPVIVIVAFVFGKFIRSLSKKTQDELAAANVIVEETLVSIQTVKAFTSELFETRRYDSALGKVVKIALKAANYRGAFISFIIFALFGGIVGVMWYGATLVSTGEISVGNLLSFILYTTFIGGSIAGLGDLYGQIQKAIGASERVIEILDEEGEELEKSGIEEIIPLEGHIQFNNVRFTYPTRMDIEVLKGVDLTINQGQKVALVGQSGAGKSTIMQLLMKFYVPTSGEITIDGHQINDLPVSAYRKNIGIVPQEVLLFGGSIGENIAYGKPGSSKEEIEKAAEKAYALDFINSFPEGMDTLVGERGVKLSGGQRQRIAIARAILKNPKILILDEATSSLDAESEFLVQKALDELMKNRTTLIIAHRLATIRKVDKIYVLADGQVIEAGTHEELSRNDEGTYSNLVRLQLQLD
ncbi:ABC transporter ATP-binding protein [Peijinzhouia sedimentorum]